MEFDRKSELLHLGSGGQGWQYGKVCLKFKHGELQKFNRTDVT